jgi:hypothetical protein
MHTFKIIQVEQTNNVLFDNKNSPSKGGASPPKYKIDELQTKMKKSRGKVVQFIAESLKEQVLEQQKNTYQLLKDSSKYVVECQQKGAKTNVLFLSAYILLA